LVEHLILSHHGSLEFGSPTLPQTREAVALHFLDDLDSKMAAMRVTLASESGNEEWTERNPALRRAILRTDTYLGQKPKPNPNTNPIATAKSVEPAASRGTAQLDFEPRKA
jgi:3'-5' exoribonuclease